MTIEEKAKAYDEAIERARLYKGLRAEMSVVFPELAESEEERLREELISFIRRQIECHDKPNAERDEKFESWIAWLEKQGEQKPVPDWMPKFLDELRSKKNYFDWDEDKEIEGGILAIIKWMNPNYFNE